MTGDEGIDGDPWNQHADALQLWTIAKRDRSHVMEGTQVCLRKTYCLLIECEKKIPGFHFHGNSFLQSTFKLFPVPLVSLLALEQNSQGWRAGSTPAAGQQMRNYIFVSDSMWWAELLSHQRDICVTIAKLNVYWAQKKSKLPICRRQQEGINAAPAPLLAGAGAWVTQVASSRGPISGWSPVVILQRTLVCKGNIFIGNHPCQPLLLLAPAHPSVLLAFCFSKEVVRLRTQKGQPGPCSPQSPAPVWQRY